MKLTLNITVGTEWYKESRNGERYPPGFQPGGVSWPAAGPTCVQARWEGTTVPRPLSPQTSGPFPKTWEKAEGDESSVPCLLKQLLSVNFYLTFVYETSRIPKYFLSFRGNVNHRMCLYPFECSTLLHFPPCPPAFSSWEWENAGRTDGECLTPHEIRQRKAGGMTCLQEAHCQAQSPPHSCQPGFPPGNSSLDLAYLCQMCTKLLRPTICEVLKNDHWQQKHLSKITIFYRTAKLSTHNCFSFPVSKGFMI